MRMIVAVLLVASAALFAIGVKIERGQVASHVEQTATPAMTPAPRASSSPTARPTITPHSESGESVAHVAAEHAGKSPAGSPHATVAPAGSLEPVHAETSGETAAHRKAELAQRVLGINADATGTVVAALAVSALLALLIATSSSPIVLVLVAAFGLLSAVFDGAEVAHQLSEHRTSVVVIATVILLFHVGAAAGAGAMMVARRRPSVT